MFLSPLNCDPRSRLLGCVRWVHTVPQSRMPDFLVFLLKIPFSNPLRCADGSLTAYLYIYCRLGENTRHARCTAQPCCEVFTNEVRIQPNVQGWSEVYPWLNIPSRMVPLTTTRCTRHGILPSVQLLLNQCPARWNNWVGHWTFPYIVINYLHVLKGGLIEQVLVTIVTAVYVCLVPFCTRWI